MTQPRRRFAPLLVLAGGLAALVLDLVAKSRTDNNEGGFLLIAAAVFTAVGALILARVPGNRVGWVVSATGLTILGSGVVGYLADQGSVTASAIGGALWLSWFFLVGSLMLWFPTGSPPTPRWRWVGWIGFAGLLISLTYVVADQICVEGGDPCAAWVDNPIGILGVPNPEFGPTAGLNFGLLAIFVFLSALSLAVRLVRSRGVERLQLKWFLYAVVFAIVVIAFQESVVGWLSIPDWIGELVFGVAVMMLPVTIGVAVLRYRLYDIDRIVSRTVSYSVVVVLLAAIYVGAVTWLTTLLPDQSELVVAATTLAVATLFNPVRKRVQGWVDRRFNRSRYDMQLVMDGFAGSLRDQVDAEMVMDGWVGVVNETMQPASVGVWMRASFRNDSGTVDG
jgi:MFS family permease